MIVDTINPPQQNFLDQRIVTKALGSVGRSSAILDSIDDIL